MKWNGTGRTRRNGRADFGTKQLIALLLALALALGMLCATAEDSDGLLLPDNATQTTDEELYIGDGVATGDSAQDLELPKDAMPGEDALVIDGVSLDGLEDNLIVNELPELDVGAEAPAAAQASNESNPEDFEIDENGVLVKYVGPGGDVVIPDGVTSIGDSAFGYCESLTSVTIPDSVTSIGYRAFSSCRSLTSVTIPDSVTSIGYDAFYSCSSLTSVTIPDGVTSIGEDAFMDCNSLTSVTIGAGVSIDDLFGSRLLDNKATVGFELTENNETYASKDGVLYTYDMHTLLRCPRVKTSVTIPDSVTSIGEGAFSDCSSLTSVTIPDGVTRIGLDAFYACYSLTSVIIPDSVTILDRWAFSHCEGLKSMTIPDSVTSIGEDAFECCDSLRSVKIGAGVGFDELSRSDLLDSDATEAITVTENNNVYASEDGVLYTYDMSTLLRCPSAKKSVTIPNGVSSIGDKAFLECINLTSVTIPDSVVRIGDMAFYDCIQLKDVYIPSSVKKIGDKAFYFYWYNDEDFWDGGLSPLDLTIHGYTGSYAETYAKKYGFKFSPIDRISLVKAKLTVKAQVYTGKALKPAVKVVLKGKTLKKGTDYTVSYKNNKAIGTATVTVKGKGRYKGTAKVTFTINPKAVTGLKLAAGKGKLTASWKKSAGGVGGYQLQYALKKSFSGGRKVTVKKASTLKATLKGLKAGKTYYVRIRAWKKVGGKTYWSAWSAAKKAKVK